MNNAYLVFDNRLVISTGHSINDPLIFAAGPLTKFSRKYRVGEWLAGELLYDIYILCTLSSTILHYILLLYCTTLWSCVLIFFRAHCQFNSCEVGEKLALTLLAKLDPTVEGQSSDDTDLLLRYNKPKVLYATLPGIHVHYTFKMVITLVCILITGGLCYLLVHKPRIDQEQNIQKEVHFIYRD